MVTDNKKHSNSHNYRLQALNQVEQLPSVLCILHANFVHIAKCELS